MYLAQCVDIVSVCLCVLSSLGLTVSRSVTLLLCPSSCANVSPPFTHTQHRAPDSDTCWATAHIRMRWTYSCHVGFKGVWILFPQTALFPQCIFSHRVTRYSLAVCKFYKFYILKVKFSKCSVSLVSERRWFCPLILEESLVPWIIHQFTSSEQKYLSIYQLQTSRRRAQR